jgi:hypothetical protein
MAEDGVNQGSHLLIQEWALKIKYLQQVAIIIRLDSRRVRVRMRLSSGLRKLGHKSANRRV